MNAKVDQFLADARQWREEYIHLRAIVLDSGLTEELKWGVPCYTHGGANVLLIHGFKEYCALLFVKGSLLDDPGELMIQQTANVQAGKQARFTSVADIVAKEAGLKALIRLAIEAEKAGKKVVFKKVDEFEMAEEFRLKLNEISGLKAAFEALTPGRQRAYLLHFLSPKQSKTREARVEKYIPKILEGKGLDD